MPMERMDNQRERSRMVAVVDRCAVGWGDFNRKRMVVFPDALVVVRGSNPRLAEEIARRQDEIRSGRRRDRTLDMTPSSLARTEPGSRLMPANTLARGGLWSGRRHAKLDIATMGGKRLSLRWNWNGNADPEIVLDCLVDVFGNRLMVHRQDAIKRPRSASQRTAITPVRLGTSPRVPPASHAPAKPTPGRRVFTAGNESNPGVAAAALRQMANPKGKQASSVLYTTVPTPHLNKPSLFSTPSSKVHLDSDAHNSESSSSLLSTHVASAPHLDANAQLVAPAAAPPVQPPQSQMPPIAQQPPQAEADEVQRLLKYLT